MARGPTTFRQRDVAAAIKAAKSAGIEVARVEIGKDGKIVIVTGKPEQPPVGDTNEWDSAV
jgi:hypothetical protein